MRIESRKSKHSFVVGILLCLTLCIDSCTQSNVKQSEQTTLLESVLSSAIMIVTEDGTFDESGIIYFDTLGHSDLAKLKIESYYDELNDSVQRKLISRLMIGLDFSNPEYMPFMNASKGDDFQIITEYDKKVKLGENVVGFFKVSNVVIENNIACFYLAFECGEQCLGSGNIIFLQKEDDLWSINRVRTLWSTKRLSEPGVPIN